MLDKNSPIPVYYQLKEDIKKKINEDFWKVGECISSERELSETYGVSRMTVRQALGELVQEEILIREKGKGTFVCEPKVKQEDMMSFSDIIKKTGGNLKTEVLEFIKIKTPEILQELASFTEVYKIDRVRKVNGEVIANEIVHIPCEICGDIDEKMLEGSLFSILEKEGHSIEHSESEIKGVLMDEKIKTIFNIENPVPLLRTYSKTFEKNNRILFVEESTYRSDKYILQVNISRREGKLK